MDAHEPNDATDQEGTDPEPTRRDVLAAAPVGLAALAAGRLDASDRDLDDLAPVTEMDTAEVTTGEFAPISLWSHADSALGGWELSDIQAETRALEVYYNDSGRVTVALEAESAPARAGAWADMDPEQAKDVAAAIYHAAVELEARGVPAEETDARE